jgi:O-antigen ligase
MSLRVTALYLLVAGLSIYAWKDWFKSLCGLILLMAIFEHEDVPKTMYGIQGLNPWNILFVMIVLAWVFHRRWEGLRWDVPRHMVILLLLYLGVILIGVARAVGDRGHLENYPLTSLLSEELINTIKWVLPGLLLFDGCRTRRRVVLALACVLGVYVVVALEVIRFMPPRAALASASALAGRRIRLGRYIGYSACDISAMLAGASWSILAALPLVRGKMRRFLMIGAAGVVTYGQALTGGRAGYLAWGAIGLVLCLLRWRKYLVLAPFVVLVLPIVFPAAAERMLSGFSQTNLAGQTTIDDYTVTSGRTLIWPYVIDKIAEAPVMGYGRLAMERTGLSDRLMEEMGESFPHPHNVYLETLLDNGILGTMPICIFWGIVIAYSLALFCSGNRLYSAVGGLALCLTLAQVIAGLGAQHYYPRVSTAGTWAAMFLMLRVHVEAQRVPGGVVWAPTIRDGLLVGEQSPFASVGTAES